MAAVHYERHAGSLILDFAIATCSSDYARTVVAHSYFLVNACLFSAVTVRIQFCELIGNTEERAKYNPLRERERETEREREIPKKKEWFQYLFTVIN